MRLFDSHAHYFDARFSSPECPEGADALLTRLFESGEVDTVINVGTDVPASLLAIAQAARFPKMYVAAGIHPSDAMRYPDMDVELEKLEKILSDPQNKIVALGEIGLDYHYPDTDKTRQTAYFTSQLALAKKLDLPVVIHDREAHGDCFDAICAAPGVRGVFHSYSGSAEMAKELTRRGWYISFSGTLTFKNANRVREAAQAVPRDRLLLETDAPYLAPHPMRGRLNHSGLMIHTVGTLAELWECAPEEAASVTAQNAKNLFLIG